MKRIIILYIMGTIIFMGAIDQRKAKINNLNYLKGIEGYLQNFLDQTEEYDEKKLKEGLKYYRALRRFLPSNAYVFGNLGFCYFYLHDYPKAIASYKKAIELQPTFFAFHYDIGRIYFLMADFKNAQKFLEGSLPLISNAEAHYTYLIKSLLEKNRKDIIPEIFKLAQRLKEDSAEIYITLSKVYSALKDYRRGEEVVGESKKDDWVRLHISPHVLISGLYGQ